MEWFQLRFKPLELYTFGTEQGSEYAGVKGTGKESYIMTSAAIPDQTTLLGTIRWMLLKKKGLLKTDFNYAETDRVSINSTIGPESFHFLNSDQNNMQSFGLLKQISPMFLSDLEQGVWIKNPFCNTSSDSFRPMKMSEPVLTSKGMIHTPVKDASVGYDAKEGYASGYINLETKKVISENDLFEQYILTGNQISQEQDEKGFYKREAYKLNARFCFSVYVKTEDQALSDGDSVIAYMGRKNNAFHVSISKVSEESANLKKQVETAFANGETWYYALSDIFFDGGYEAKDFCIVEEKHLRNIETKLFERNGYAKKRNKNSRIHLAAKGSCFYGAAPSFNNRINCETAGYNCIAKLGGN